MKPSAEGWELVYDFRLGEPTVLLNVWQRMHWSAQKKHMIDLSWSVVEAVGRRPPQPLSAAWVHVERGNPKPFPDPDGLVGGLKPLLDVLSCARLRKPHGLGFIVDDAPQYLQRLTWTCTPTPRGEGYTRVFIYRPAPGALRRAA